MCEGERERENSLPQLPNSSVGHSDVVMGVLATNSEPLDTKLKFLQNSIGAVPAPFDCYMAMRGLKTLALRMDRHSENAMKVGGERGWRDTRRML
jgi:cystathionine beta-lyase/cystathionine gamma-synthase